MFFTICKRFLFTQLKEKPFSAFKHQYLFAPSIYYFSSFADNLKSDMKQKKRVADSESSFSESNEQETVKPYYFVRVKFYLLERVNEPEKQKQRMMLLSQLRRKWNLQKILESNMMYCR